MAVYDMLDQSCDIYHLRSKKQKLKGFLEPTKVYYYVDEPDLRDVACHFGLKYRDTFMLQKEPYNDYYARYKLVLPIDTDIRLNDKILDKESGLVYTAQVPKRIRGSHLVVFVKRTKLDEAL